MKRKESTMGISTGWMIRMAEILKEMLLLGACCEVSTRHLANQRLLATPTSKPSTRKTASVTLHGGMKVVTEGSEYAKQSDIDQAQPQLRPEHL
jgi:hypothetical protein